MKKDNEYKWKKCCVKEIERVWNKDPFNIVWYQGKCQKCGHFIGLTQTTKREAKKFLLEYNLTL